MSSAGVAAGVVKDLEPEDYRILRAFVSSLKNYKSLSENQLAVASGMHRDSARFRASKIHKLNLISRNETGYSLVMAGLDALALKTLADREIINGMGQPIGIGKESDVYEAISQDGSEVAIKFFRIGRTSFRDVSRKRSFTGIKDSDERKSYGSSQLHQWLSINIDAATKEEAILRKIRSNNLAIRVPEIKLRAFHCVAMNRIQGSRLVDTKDIGNAEKVLDEIIRYVSSACGAGIINGDLSEYNILIDYKDDPWIIDWPQSVSTKHPNAEALLKRDVSNVVRFFGRKFGIEKDFEVVFEEVKKSLLGKR